MERKHDELVDALIVAHRAHPPAEPYGTTHLDPAPDLLSPAEDAVICQDLRDFFRDCERVLPPFMLQIMRCSRRYWDCLPLYTEPVGPIIKNKS